MQHHIRRWHRDHSGELISAWLNGVGVMVWEVVFGAWVGWNDRDAATLRRMLPVQRRLHRWLVDGEWTPLAVCEPSGLVGSAFALDGHDPPRSWRTRPTSTSSTVPEGAGRGSPCTTTRMPCRRIGTRRDRRCPPAASLRVLHVSRARCGRCPRRLDADSARSSQGARTSRTPRSRIAARGASRPPAWQGRRRSRESAHDCRRAPFALPPGSG